MEVVRERLRVLLKKSPCPPVLDLLHARKVSLMNLRFNTAQVPRYPDYRPSANPLYKGCNAKASLVREVAQSAGGFLCERAA